MELDENDYEDDTIHARKFHLVFVVAHLLAFLSNSALAWKMLFGGLASELAGHSAHVANRDIFAAEAGAEIEKMLKGEDA